MMKIAILVFCGIVIVAALVLFVSTAIKLLRGRCCEGCEGCSQAEHCSSKVPEKHK